MTRVLPSWWDIRADSPENLLAHAVSMPGNRAWLGEQRAALQRALADIETLVDQTADVLRETESVAFIEAKSTEVTGRRGSVSDETAKHVSRCNPEVVHLRRTLTKLKARRNPIQEQLDRVNGYIAAFEQMSTLIPGLVGIHRDELRGMERTK